MSSITLQKKISQIVSSWFYTQPLFFAVCSSHSIIQNNSLLIPFRAGKKRIEYSAKLLDSATDEKLSFLLQTEVTRILLGHPYQRKPHNAKSYILSLASDAVIWSLACANSKKKNELQNNYLDLLGVQYVRQMVGPFATFSDMDFYQWYKFIFDLIAKAKNGLNFANSATFENGDAFEQMSELWQEDQNVLDELMQDVKDSIVKDEFGKDGGLLERTICELSDFSFDYRKALTQFRQKIVSAKRNLTRMRPSRRYGFKAMGSRYERKANILIAIDVSGSITDESFEHFTHAIKNFFFLGIIEKIDLIFFDVNLKLSKPVSFNKKIELEKITGRGGTNFQVAIDFYFEHLSEYSGMIIFTDGQGDVPDVKNVGQNILWILDSRLAFENSKSWITKSCNSRATYLPF